MMQAPKQLRQTAAGWRRGKPGDAEHGAGVLQRNPTSLPPPPAPCISPQPPRTPLQCQGCLCFPWAAPPDLGAQLDKKHPFFRASRAKKAQNNRRQEQHQRESSLCVSWKERQREQGVSPALVTLHPGAHSSCPCSTTGRGGCATAEPDVVPAVEMRQGRCWKTRQLTSPVLFFHSLETKEEMGLDSVLTCGGGAGWVSSSARGYQGVGTSISPAFNF